MAAASRTRRSPPISARCGSRRCATPKAIGALPAGQPAGSVRSRILVARTGEARRSEIAALHRTGRARHRRRRARSARRRPRPSRSAAPMSPCVDLDAGKAGRSRRRSATPRSASAATSPIRPRCAPPSTGGRDLWRRRHRRLQCRRRLGRRDRRRWTTRAAPELRAQLLRPSERGAECRADHAAAGHRRRAAVQRLQAGGQSRRQFRRLWPRQGGDPVPVAPICAGARQGRHPRQRRQCRPHPLRASSTTR